MTDDDEALAAELLLRSEAGGDAPASLEERFLHYLTMEYFVTLMRRQRGLNNREIMELCRKVDHESGQESSPSDHEPQGSPRGAPRGE